MECGTCERELPRRAEFCPGCGAAVKKTDNRRASDVSSRGPYVAGLGLRFIALLIDGVIVAGIAALVAVLVQLPPWIVKPVQMDLEIPMIDSVSPLVLILLAVYYGIMEATRGATIGKLAFGLTVRTMDGRRVDPARAIARAVLRIISFATVIGWILALLTHRRQALHDIIVGTYVTE